MLNRIVLIGRLTRDPELRYTQSGVAVARFTLAVDRRFKSANGEREADFIDIVVWRQMAETCNTYLSKGKLCAVDGSLQIRSYEDKNGVRRKAAEVVAEDVRFLSPKEGGSYGGERSQAPSQGFGSRESNPFDQNNDADMVGDDDLPF